MSLQLLELTFRGSLVAARESFLADAAAPWLSEQGRVGDDPAGLNAVEIEGPSWHE